MSAVWGGVLCHLPTDGWVSTYSGSYHRSSEVWWSSLLPLQAKGETEHMVFNRCRKGGVSCQWRMRSGLTLILGCLLRPTGGLSASGGQNVDSHRSIWDPWVAGWDGVLDSSELRRCDCRAGTQRERLVRASHWQSPQHLVFYRLWDGQMVWWLYGEQGLCSCSPACPPSLYCSFLGRPSAGMTASWSCGRNAATNQSCRQVHAHPEYVAVQMHEQFHLKLNVLRPFIFFQVCWLTHEFIFFMV